MITDQNIVKGQKQNGFPMRKWKISLTGVNANGDDEPMPYVDYVEYILHQTFEQPLRSMLAQINHRSSFTLALLLIFSRLTDLLIPGYRTHQPTACCFLSYHRGDRVSICVTGEGVGRVRHEDHAALCRKVGATVRAGS